MEKMKEVKLAELLKQLDESERIVTKTTDEILSILTEEFGEEYLSQFQDDDFFCTLPRENNKLLDPKAFIQYFSNKIIS